MNLDNLLWEVEDSALNSDMTKFNIEVSDNIQLINRSYRNDNTMLKMKSKFILMELVRFSIVRGFLNI